MEGWGDRRVFVDAHCHLFTIEDIPLYATADRKITAKSMLALGAALASAGRQLKRFEPFIKFFERSIDTNLRSLVAQVQKVADGRDVVLTPLIMDFDLIPGSEESVARQTERLRSAIERCYAGDSSVAVHPFVGYDLRKLEGDPELVAFKQFWEQCHPEDSPPGAIPGLACGEVIGIKLYPPIGFSPYPNSLQKRECYLKFYKWCAGNGVPITVHCQMGSYSANKTTQKQIEGWTSPRHWEKVLGEPGLSDLRINFAHFGGEDAVADTVYNFLSSKLEKGTWPYTIMRLLMDPKYPNTYADISAFDFTNQKARKALAKLIKMDQDGTLAHELGLEDEPLPLTSKLIWGSDVPMVIWHKAYRSGAKSLGSPHYRNLYDLFRQTLKATGPNSAALEEAFTETNPKRFLFG